MMSAALRRRAITISPAIIFWTRAVVPTLKSIATSCQRCQQITIRGRATILGHEVGHRVIKEPEGRDENDLKPGGRNVELNENPIRRDLGLSESTHVRRQPGSPVKTKQTFRMTVLLLVVLMGSSCVLPRHSSVGAPSGISEYDAVRLARQALAQRRLFLPKGAYANVEESYADQGRGKGSVFESRQIGLEQAEGTPTNLVRDVNPWNSTAPGYTCSVPFRTNSDTGTA
jgi:hypothetical protein